MSMQDKEHHEGHSILMYGANNSDRSLIIFDPSKGSQGGNKKVSYDDFVEGAATGYKGFVYEHTVYCTTHY